MTEVSIQLITYERPAMCEVALCSALTTAAAAGVDTRIVLVDNGSTTDYAERLATRYGTDLRRMPTNRPDAVPTAFGAVESTYAAVLYDDDVLLPRWLPAHLEVMAQGFDVVAGSFYLVDSELRVTGSRACRPATFADLRRNVVACNDGSLIRTAVLEGVPWRVDRQPWLWLALWLELARRGARFGAVSEPTWLYRQHAGQHIRHVTDEERATRMATLAEYAA